MPIANCFVAAQCLPGSGDITELWSAETGFGRDEMTVNVVEVTEQYGKPYSVLATLYLPTLWSPDRISALQLGLAKTLAQCFNQPLAQVFVITTLVVSGQVVEAGQEQHF